MNDYSVLEDRFSPLCIKLAIQCAKNNAALYQPSYYTGEDFEPHIWVVASIADAMTRLGF